MNRREWEEWSRRSDSEVMRQDFCLEATDRKLRLFAVACCRRVQQLLGDERSRRAVDAAEQFADGLISQVQLEEACRAAEDAERIAQAILGENDDFYFGYHAARAAQLTAEKDIRLWLDDIARSMFDIVSFNPDASEETENQVHRCLLLDLFNPFRPGDLDPRWQTSTVVDLARAIYDQDAFDRMPVLADALMDAGCDIDEIIVHCRQSGDHVRGCWVVDLLLARE
jgi:hypothetical protein